MAQSESLTKANQSILRGLATDGYIYIIAKGEAAGDAVYATIEARDQLRAMGVKNITPFGPSGAHLDTQSLCDAAGGKDALELNVLCYAINRGSSESQLPFRGDRVVLKPPQR